MDIRPPVFSIRLSNLFSLPSRLCHPPTPKASKVRSCSVVPSFQVALDDVLERRHLPPLGLKDFEEWLLFVENKPQYLYFILWLKKYKHRYAQWTKNAEEKTRIGTRPVCGPLSIFYTRAKQTFFAPCSPYHLSVLTLATPALLSLTHACLSSDISQPTLAQFLKPPMDSVTDSPHPHPSAFARLESEARAILSRSLQAFVRASYANVSCNRAICGVIGGIMISLIFGALPLLVIIFNVTSRWLRFLAWPGLVIGLTILISSFNGLCIGIYIFGDARQLRNFELVRPTIEKTSAIAITPVTSDFSRSPSSPSPAALIRHKWVVEQNIQKENISSRISIHSAYTNPSIEDHSGNQENPTMDIYVSRAMDPDTGEYSATTSLHHAGSHEVQEFPATASFIPHDHLVIDPRQGTQEDRSPDDDERFDFHGLPPLSSVKDSMDPSSRPKDASSQPQSIRFQSQGADVDSESGKMPSGEAAPSLRSPSQLNEGPHYGSVPPFGPLTPVVNPVVVRAYWEILARSSAIGGVVSLAVVGALVAVPEVRFMEPVVG